MKGPMYRYHIDRNVRTSTVLALANTIYDTHDATLLPILADAMMDAGFNDKTVLDYCRQATFWCRGEWLIDTILHKY